MARHGGKGHRVCCRRRVCLSEVRLTPVFLGINFRADGEAGQLVTEHLSIPFYRIDEQMTSGEVIGVLSRMTAVVSMASARAHLRRRTGRAAHRRRL